MLILASASPRRHELLNQVALQHLIVPAHIDETQLPNETPVSYVERLALGKAKAVAEQHPQHCVLAADTTVVLDGLVLNKPHDVDEAERMLRSLSGRAHLVHTGIAVSFGGTTRSHVESTRVTVGVIPQDELSTYLLTGDSLDKAGGYGIQGYAARWITGIEGDFFNVVGLPLASVLYLLRPIFSSSTAVSAPNSTVA